MTDITERERLAHLFDPNAFDMISVRHIKPMRRIERRQAAYAKADQYLSTQPPPSSESEREGLGRLDFNGLTGTIVYAGPSDWGFCFNVHFDHMSEPEAWSKICGDELNKIKLLPATRPSTVDAALVERVTRWLDMGLAISIADTGGRNALKRDVRVLLSAAQGLKDEVKQ